jgi:hypothetical protein
MCHLVMFQAQRGGLEVVWQTQPSKFLAVSIISGCQWITIFESNDPPTTLILNLYELSSI